MLDWCKLFTDYKGEHHWHHVVDDRARFKKDLYTTLGVEADEFIKTIREVKHYRDTFVAHLDKERTMLLPALEVARQATVFLYERLAQMIASPKEWRDLPASTEELAVVYKRASQQAEAVYAEAVRARSGYDPRHPHAEGLTDARHFAREASRTNYTGLPRPKRFICA